MSPNRGRKTPRARHIGERIRRSPASERVRGAAVGVRDALRSDTARARRKEARPALGAALGAAAAGARGVGEALGRAELAISRRLSGPMLAARRAGAATLGATERLLTPARGVAVVVLGAAILLAASQFADYRGVGIGAALYEDVEAIASAPLTDRERAGSAHSYVMVPIAALAVAALVFALRGRWQLGRAVALLGAIGVAISLLVDMPKGLDEGLTARSFEGAEATLLGGFWVQLTSSAVLVVAGLLLARYARLERRSPARRERGVGRRAGASPAQGARA